MLVRFRDAGLEEVERTPHADGGLAEAIVKAFRKRMQTIRSAPDERVFRAMASLHFEKLKGTRSHQRSMRLNDQWRLILEFEGEGSSKVAVIVGIEDYHR